MTQTQQPEIIVTNPDAARALNEVQFLGQFFEPASPSEVARTLKMAASLAHHHAKRLGALGLLFKVRREGRKVYYQLAARTFKYEQGLLPMHDPGNHATEVLQALSQDCLNALERSGNIPSDQDPGYAIFAFGGGDQPPEPQPGRTGPPAEARPAHYQSRILHLSPASYLKLVRQIGELIRDSASEQQPDAAICTLAFTAFDGPSREGVMDSWDMISFVPQG